MSAVKILENLRGNMSEEEWKEFVEKALSEQAYERVAGNEDALWVLAFFGITLEHKGEKIEPPEVQEDAKELEKRLDRLPWEVLCTVLLILATAGVSLQLLKEIEEKFPKPSWEDQERWIFRRKDLASFFYFLEGRKGARIFAPCLLKPRLKRDRALLKYLGIRPMLTDTGEILFEIKKKRFKELKESGQLQRLLKQAEEDIFG